MNRLIERYRWSGGRKAKDRRCLAGLFLITSIATRVYSKMYSWRRIRLKIYTGFLGYLSNHVNMRFLKFVCTEVAKCLLKYVILVSCRSKFESLLQAAGDGGSR